MVCEQEKEALAREVEHLNSTVFSKHFKAPSAWAEREVKYKMEKRDWDAEKKKLRELLQKLEAENATYRASNKSAEFEAQIQVRPASGDIDLPLAPHNRFAKSFLCATSVHAHDCHGPSKREPLRQRSLLLTANCDHFCTLLAHESSVCKDATSMSLQSYS